MAKRKSRRKFELGLEPETVYGIIVILFVVLSIFFVFAALGKAGVVGDYTYKGLSYLLGIGYFLLPALALVLAIAFFKAIHRDLFGVTKLLGSVVFLLAGLGLIELLFADRGGLIGGWVALPLDRLFDGYVSGIALAALFFISLIVLFEIKLSEFWLEMKERHAERREERLERKQEKQEEREAQLAEKEEAEKIRREADALEEDEDEIEEEGGEDAEADEEDEEEPKRGLFGKKKTKDEEGFVPLQNIHTQKKYVPPPLKLFEKAHGKPRAGDVKANANIIKRTFANFGIDVEIEEITVGPSVTQYAIKPAEGVRLAKILSLQNNLELALAAHPVRIEAPIPGKSLVGIEIPNSTKTIVGIGSLLGTKEFKNFTKPLAVTLGRGVSGAASIASISKMPHVLIAGATGAGKSVTIHTLITSLLYKNGPGHLKFVMVDPKRVELPLYNGIPHLLTPVITDAKKAILALKWLVREMERRYEVLEEYSVRDVASYHNTILAPALDNTPEDEDMPETLPYIVLVIDELADIMSTYPRELEAGIVRLAQMSRAVGIHLVLSTQRPSVNVITGLIKANIPARIALQVASQVDSRTILDMSGAEKLLGAGDMLYLSGDMSKPIRLQSGFISEPEVKRVAKYLRKQYGSSEEDIEFDMTEEIEDGDGGGDFDDEEEDELYEDARETVIEAGKASTSYLQRKLRVGYARAARLMDMLEDRSVIGPQDGSKAREILVDNGYGNEDEE